MRILLISGIVFVHVPYDPQTSPFLGENGFIDWLRVFVGDSLFRVGVPCLSAISGYLLFRRGLAGLDYGKVLRSKSRTVLVPFLIWNFAFLGLVMLAQSRGIGFGYLPDIVHAGPHELTTLAFAIDGLPINMPLYFLRDLLLCIILAPLLGLAVQKYPRITLAILFLYAILPVPGLIFLKKGILFGFAFGIYASLYRIDIRILDRHAKKIALVFLTVATLLATALYRTGPDHPPLVDVARNLIAISGIVASWAISAILIRIPLGTRLARTEGLSFWIFCAHYPLLIAFWMLWNRMAEAQHYPLFYVLAPLLTLVVLVITHTLAKRVTPGLHAVLTGCRASRTLPSAVRPGEEPAGAKDWTESYANRKKMT